MISHLSRFLPWTRSGFLEAKQENEACGAQTPILLNLPPGVLGGYLWPKLGPWSQAQIRGVCRELRGAADRQLPDTFHVSLDMLDLGSAGTGGTHGAPTLPTVCGVLARVPHVSGLHVGIEKGRMGGPSKVSPSSGLAAAITALGKAAAAAAGSDASGGGITAFTLICNSPMGCDSSVLAAICEAFPKLQSLTWEVSEVVGSVAGWAQAAKALPATLHTLHWRVRTPSRSKLSLQHHLAGATQLAGALRDLSLSLPGEDLDAALITPVAGGLVRCCLLSPTSWDTVPNLEQLLAACNATLTHAVLPAPPALTAAMSFTHALGADLHNLTHVCVNLEVLLSQGWDWVRLGCVLADIEVACPALEALEVHNCPAWMLLSAFTFGSQQRTARNRREFQDLEQQQLQQLRRQLELLLQAEGTQRSEETQQRNEEMQQTETQQTEETRQTQDAQPPQRLLVRPEDSCFKSLKLLAVGGGDMGMGELRMVMELLHPACKMCLLSGVGVVSIHAVDRRGVLRLVQGQRMGRWWAERGSARLVGAWAHWDERGAASELAGVLPLRLPFEELRMEDMPAEDGAVHGGGEAPWALPLVGASKDMVELAAFLREIRGVSLSQGVADVLAGQLEALVGQEGDLGRGGGGAMGAEEGEGGRPSNEGEQELPCWLVDAMAGHTVLAIRSEEGGGRLLQALPPALARGALPSLQQLVVMDAHLLHPEEGPALLARVVQAASDAQASGAEAAPVACGSGGGGGGAVHVSAPGGGLEIQLVDGGEEVDVRRVVEVVRRRWLADPDAVRLRRL